jgi:hypothetical protein
VILHCNYEELQALRSGARSLLDDDPASRCTVAAVESKRAGVEALLPHLAGDLDFHTLGELRNIASAVAAIVECLKAEMDSVVAATHPAHENAVAAYFDYAHAYSVLERLRELDEQMEAMIEVVIGGRPDDRVIREFVFPD